MSFQTKCYNGHKFIIEDDLDGETVECPLCGEDFIVAKEYEEIGSLNGMPVPLNTLGYIHMSIGLLVGVLLTFIFKMVSEWSYHSIWRVVTYFSIIIGLIYFVRGLVELFRNKDPLWKIKRIFFAIYYIVLKKVKFYRR